jgi:hypothetical protein
VNRAEKRCPMMHSALQGERRGINREGGVTLKPFGVILERNGLPAFSGMKPSHQLGFALPINMDFHAHDLAR